MGLPFTGEGYNQCPAPELITDYRPMVVQLLEIIETLGGLDEDSAEALSRRTIDHYNLLLGITQPQPEDPPKHPDPLTQELIEDLDVILGLAQHGRVVHIANIAKSAIAKAQKGLD